MTTLVDRYGRPFPDTAFRRDKPSAVGESFDIGTPFGLSGSWAAQAMMQFDLDRLTVADHRAMRAHPQVNASLSVLTFMIHQNDWRIECEDKKVVSQAEENLADIWTDLVRAMSQAFWAGRSPCVLEWENDAQGKFVILNKIKDLPPEYCEVNWKTVPGHYNPPGSSVTQKVKVFDGIKKLGMPYAIPVEHSFWYPAFIQNNDWTGTKMLNPAFMPWYFSILVHMYNVRYLERFGEPTPVGRAPFDEEFDVGGNKKQTGKQIMEGILANVRNRGAVTLPSERDPVISNTGTSTGRPPYLWDIEFLESQMRGGDFEHFLARLDEEISLAIFTPTLLMRSGDVGSNNLGVQHTQTWLWMCNAIMGDMKKYIDKFIVERIKAYAFSPNAPRARWVPRKLGKDSIDTVRSVMVELIRGDKATVDLEQLGAALGMSVEKVRQVTAPPADPNAPPDGRQRTERTPSGDGPRQVGQEPAVQGNTQTG